MRAQLAKIAWSSLGGEPSDVDNVLFTGSGGLASPYAVTDFASATVATAGLAVAELVRALGGGEAAVSVDRRLASIWFGSSLRPIGWSLPPIWDPIAGNYRARDGWIRLHTNAPHHRAAAERVLAAGGDRSAVAAAVAEWQAGELEAAIVEAGGCAAKMRSSPEWERHPQGRTVAAEPLVHLEAVAARADSAPGWTPPLERPLHGIRVLDLTRVLAGPVASRFLAGYGADVLRIDPPGWEEASLVPEVTLGKRCARLDLRERADRETFESLLATADVLLHGYRPGALEQLGFGEAARRKLAPDVVDIALCAYGWSGPWAARRGFDSLVQMSAGIADAGMKWRRTDVPIPLPVQALDHATGYLMAAAAIRGLTRRVAGSVTTAKLSLARTALLLRANPARGERPFPQESDSDVTEAIEETAWGSARRVRVPLAVEGVPLHWDFPACELGSAAPAWRARRESNPHLRV